MRRLVTACLTVVFAAMSLGAWAATAKTKSNLHSSSGTIENWDASAHTLTLKAAKGSTVFSVDPDAKVWVGSKSTGLDDLAKDVGAKATVKYAQSGGQKVVKTIRVTASSTKPKSK